MSTVISYATARKIFEQAKVKGFAFPAVNVTGTNTINATLEAAREVNSPVIIQFSNSGAAFFAGKSIENNSQRASVVGAVAGARYVHEVSALYGLPVLLNTDHAAKKLLPWVDGMIVEGKKYFDTWGTPLFTSHMLDLSGELLKENIEISKRYLEKLTAMDMYLEIELGVTGGEEDGVDHSEIDSSRLYTRPEEVAYAYEELMKVSDHFVIAAAFGNVHGVYKPGNVKLEPGILGQSQDFISKKFKTHPRPVSFVFHGGSGSTREEIQQAISFGVIKMNIDTDLQWANWEGVHNYYKKFEPYLQSQLGNPSGADAPNKKYYDGRSWMRAGEEAMRKRLVKAFTELNAVGSAAVLSL